MRYLLNKHIRIVSELVTILGSFGRTLGVMPFFGKAPLAAAEGRRVRLDCSVFNVPSNTV